VVSGHHLLIISSVKPLYNGKFILKIIPEVISKVRYFSEMYKKNPEVLQNTEITLEFTHDGPMAHHE
jgi:hypothetical protein